MKKTLILTASLLAATAFADETLTLPYTAGYFVTTSGTTTSISADGHILKWDTSSATGVGGSVSSFMVTFTLGELDAFTSTDYRRLFAVQSTGSTHNATGLGVSLKKDGTSFTLAITKDSGNGNAIGTVTLAAEANHVYSFAVNSTNTTTYLLDQTAYAASDTFDSSSLLTADVSTVTNKTLGSTSVFWGSAPITVGAVTNMAEAAATTSPISFQAAMVQAYETASVPEPATATLSLLALAGLAARRRRH